MLAHRLVFGRLSQLARLLARKEPNQKDNKQQLERAQWLLLAGNTFPLSISQLPPISRSSEDTNSARLAPVLFWPQSARTESSIICLQKGAK